MLVYPNPTNAFFNIAVSNQFINTNAYLVDANGRLIRVINIQNEITKVDISSLTKGIYLLRFANDHTEKITKQK